MKRFFLVLFVVATTASLGFPAIAAQTAPAGQAQPPTQQQQQRMANDARYEHRPR